MTPTPPQLATILAALRYWQDNHDDGLDDEQIEGIASMGGQMEPLSPDSVAELYEHLSAGPQGTLPVHPLELLREMVDTYGAALDGDDEVNGSDAVEWICDFVNRARGSATIWRTRQDAYLTAIESFHAAAAESGRGGDGRATRIVARLESSARLRLGAGLLPSRGEVPVASPVDLLDQAIAAFGPAMDADDEINGANTVEWLAEFLPKVRVVIKRYPDQLMTTA